MSGHIRPTWQRRYTLFVTAVALIMIALTAIIGLVRGSATVDRFAPFAAGFAVTAVVAGMAVRAGRFIVYLIAFVAVAVVVFVVAVVTQGGVHASPLVYCSAGVAIGLVATSLARVLYPRYFGEDPNAR